MWGMKRAGAILTIIVGSAFFLMASILGLILMALFSDGHSNLNLNELDEWRNFTSVLQPFVWTVAIIGILQIVFGSLFCLKKVQIKIGWLIIALQIVSIALDIIINVLINSSDIAKNVDFKFRTNGLYGYTFQIIVIVFTCLHIVNAKKLKEQLGNNVS